MMKTILLMCTAYALKAQPYAISTIAGGAPPPTPVAAIQAATRPSPGIFADGQNVYFTSSNVVFKVDSSGTMTRVAGNSRWGSSTSGTLALNAQFSTAGALVEDHSGNLF